MTPELLSPDEMAYHADVVAQVKAAQAAWASWSTHLTVKYALGPDDRIAESGAIERKGEKE